MPFQSWVSVPNSPGEGAGSAYASSSTLTDVSPAPQFYSQTYGPMYVGQRFRFTAYGLYSNTSTPTLSMGIYYGGVAGTAVCTTPSITTTTGASSWWWRMQVYLEVRSLGSSGTVWAQGWFDNPTSATAMTTYIMSNTSQTVTINTTTNSVLTAGAVWGTSSASNTLTVEGYIVEQLN